MTIPVRFTRKPLGLADVRAAAADPGATIYDAEIAAVEELAAAEYDEFTGHFLRDRWWLSGQGGWTDRRTRRVVAVAAPDRPTLYVDPSGGSYARYVGLAVPAAWPARFDLDREVIDPMRHARTWLRAARDVLAQPGRTEMADHLLARGLSQLGAALASAELIPPPAAKDPASKPYSVLLLYPDHANDDGTETYYACVEAPDPIAAVAEARRRALAANEWADGDHVKATDFAPLLVTEGHHRGQPMSND